MVIDEVHYLRRARDVRLVAGAAKVIAEANRRRVAVVLVTNQAGIGRGIYGWPEFARVQERIVADLAAAGARLDAVYACPHHAEGRAPYDHPDHPARKPNPGMLSRAVEALALDAGASWIVGDRASDLEAGRGAGPMGRAARADRLRGAPGRARGGPGPRRRAIPDARRGVHRRCPVEGFPVRRVFWIGLMVPIRSRFPFAR